MHDERVFDLVRLDGETAIRLDVVENAGTVLVCLSNNTGYYNIQHFSCPNFSEFGPTLYRLYHPDKMGGVWLPVPVSTVRCCSRNFTAAFLNRIKLFFHWFANRWTM
jgi:hypothetical protein